METNVYVVKFDGCVMRYAEHRADLDKLGLDSKSLETARMLAEDDCVLVLVGNILMALYEEGVLEEAVVIGVCENASGYRM